MEKFHDKTQLQVVVKMFKTMKKRNKNISYELFAFLSGNGRNDRFFNPIRHFHRLDRNRMSTEVSDACMYQ